LRDRLAQCVKQSPLPSRATTNARRRPRRSPRKIGLGHVDCQSRRSLFCARSLIVASRVRRNFRTGATHRSSLRFPTRRPFFPDEVAHVGLHDGVHRWSCVNAICARLGARVERHAQCPLIPQDLTRRRTSARARFPGRTRALAITPRGHLRPDKRGRERPPSKRVRGRLRGVAEGVLTPPARVPPSSARRPRRHRAPPPSRWLRQRIASSVSGLRLHILSTRPTVSVVDPSSSSAARGGTTHPRGVVPPFCPPNTPQQGLR
jgi:hypothetical protein